MLALSEHPAVFPVMHVELVLSTEVLISSSAELTLQLFVLLLTNAGLLLRRIGLTSCGSSTCSTLCVNICRYRFLLGGRRILTGFGIGGVYSINLTETVLKHLYLGLS